jgi:hypothetical protein
LLALKFFPPSQKSGGIKKKKPQTIRLQNDMRKQIKLAVLAAAAGMAAVSAQAVTYNDDLIVGFTSASGNDYLYDLGSAASLYSGESWNLSSALSGFNLNTVYWGVIGDVSVSHSVPGYAYSTTDGSYVPRPVLNFSDLSGNIDTPTASIYGSFSAAGAGNSASVAASQGNSWDTETLNPNLSTDYINSFENPNMLGSGTDIFYMMQDNNSSAQIAGYFTLGSNGTLTFVPEPSTIGLLTGAGLLMVLLRNKFRRNQLT